MQLVSTTLVLILIAAAPAFSLRGQHYEPPTGEPGFKKVNGFSGHLKLDDYPYDYLQLWLDPLEVVTVRAMPVMKRGETMGAFVELMGCRQSGRGVCNTRVNYTIYKPNGSIFTTRAVRQREILWKKQTPTSGPGTRKGLARMHFKLRKNDPSGEYKVKAKVSDLNADIFFEVELTFDLR